jgi:hypothetical protein
MFDGNLWIITRRKKTNTESRIRLLDIPKRIIEKYADQRLDNHAFICRATAIATTSCARSASNAALKTN